jgi:hypothetical protein
MGFHFEILIFLGLIVAEVTVVVAVLVAVVRFLTRIMRREWERAGSPRV